MIAASGEYTVLKQVREWVMKKSSGVIYIKKGWLFAGLFALVWLAIFVGKFAGNSGEETASAETAATGEEEKEYIKWVDFDVTKEALQRAYEYDLETHETACPVHWVDLLAYLGAKYGGDFSRYRDSDLDEAAQLFQSGEISAEQLTMEMKYYSYYREAYGAVLDGMVGEYQIEETDGAGTRWVTKYGLKAFHPLAKGFPYSDYDDFGTSRNYGYSRPHLGHDMMAQVGTPVIAVESGYVFLLGWNQYGGWRIGINSFDGKRYYYYAHLRKDFPYAGWLEEGCAVQAGDVIGYVGRTGYSVSENVNNIDEYHLHFGMQLIFDESQRDGTNQIWIDVYPLIRFLYQNRSEAVRDDATKEWSRLVPFRDPAVQNWQMNARQDPLQMQLF